MRAVVKRGERKTRTYRTSELQTNTWYVSSGSRPSGLNPGYVLFAFDANGSCLLNGDLVLGMTPDTQPTVWCSDWLLADEQTIRWDKASGRFTAQPVGDGEPRCVRPAVMSRWALYEIVKAGEPEWVGRVVQRLQSDVVVAIGESKCLSHDLGSLCGWLLRPVQPEDTIVFEED